MVKFSRRHFLQAAGATLATTSLHQLAQRQQAVLAQPTRRKLALIVGINEYADPKQNLRGCVNDAILQRQLLIHRFGFNPDDIVMLLDEDATREGMLTAFEEHLIDQAKPGDVAVFHFSGHGSLVSDPDPIYRDAATGRGLAGTIVPTDGSLPPSGGTVPDIMGHTLFLLMAALQTDNFTAVLDSCYSGASTREIRVRSRDGGEQVQIDPAEKAYQDRWLSRLDWTRDQYVNRYRQGIANGVALAATQPDQLAIDASLNGFFAGAFSYRLTQYLWQQDATPAEAIAAIAPTFPRRYRQRPQLEVEPGSDFGEQPLYFADTVNPPGQAVAFNQEGDRVRLLLVGIDPGQVQPGLVLRGPNRRDRVEIVQRDGLVAEGVVRGEIPTGTILRHQE